MKAYREAVFFWKLAILDLFSLFSSFQQLTENKCSLQELLIVGVKPWFSCDESDFYANCATTTAQGRITLF